MKMIEHGHCLFASEVCAAEEVGDDKWVLRDVDEDEPGVPPPSGACCRDLTVACHGSLRFEGVLLVPLFLFWVFQYAASQHGDASLLSVCFSITWFHSPMCAHCMQEEKEGRTEDRRISILENLL